jgi:oxazoline/thiazoline dehydrogenase
VTAGGLLLTVRAELRHDGDGSKRLEAGGAVLALPRAGSPERAPVDRLLTGPAGRAELEMLTAPWGTTGLARWMLWARRAHERGLLGYRLQTGRSAALAELLPTVRTAPNFTVADPPARENVRLQLSRFAVLHREGNRFILESPLATMRAELSADAVAAVAACSVPVATDGPLPFPAMSAAEAEVFVSVLLAAGLLAEVDEDGLLAEDHHAALSQWEFSDLLLHARTRTARLNAPRGGTFRFAGLRHAPPAVPVPRRSVGGRPQIALVRPDLDRLRAEDPPFAQVMEDRSSRRDLGPVTAAQLGEFLFRTMRVRRLRAPDDGANGYPRTERPYPSAGGMYEFTTYLGVGDCHDIPAGLYRYDPVQHGLDLIAPPGPDLDALLADGAGAAGMSTLPPVLVLLAADFRLLSWKYEGIAYALTLKNVGVLYQSMQLAATAMGLGSCPVGAGDAELFARAAGTDPAEESTVGEFLLGS